MSASTLRARRVLTAFSLACVLGSAARAQNTTLVSQLPLGSGVNYDLWAGGNHVYVAGGSRGLDVIDVANPASPVRVASVLPYAHADFVDVQLAGTHLYVANEVANGSPTPHAGLFIYDVSAPAAPVEVSRLEWGQGPWYHLGASVENLCVDEGASGTTVYLASLISSAVEVFDVSAPASPVWLASIYPPPAPPGNWLSASHAMTVQDGRLYTAWHGGGFTVHEVSSPANPVQVASHNFAGAWFLDVWPSEDGAFAFTADDTAPGRLKIWDLSAPGSVALAGSYTGPTAATLNRVIVSGKFAYLAYLEDGLRILDVSNPAAPVSVGHFDPEADAVSGAFEGVWGVFPFADNVYLSHTAGGLYVVDFVDTIAITTATWTRRTRTLLVEATSTAAPSVELTVQGFGAMSYSATLDKYTFSVSGVSAPRSVTVTSDIGGSRTATVKKK